MALGFPAQKFESKKELNLKSIVNYQSAIFTDLLKEFEIKKQNSIEVKATKKTLKELCLISKGDTKQKNKIRELIGIKKGEATNVNNQSLEEMYTLVTKYLGQKFKKEKNKTVKENILYAYLKKYLRHEIKQSVWIGNHNVDLYIPRKNLVIEIDGSIHDREFKIRKDQLKNKIIIKELGINLYTILNVDINANGHRIKEFIKDYKTIGSKRIYKIKRDVHIETISKYLSIKHISKLTRIDLTQLHIENINELVKKGYGCHERTSGRAKKKYLNGRNSIQKIKRKKRLQKKTCGAKNWNT